MSTEAETRRLSRLGLVGLLAAVLMVFLAPVVGGLNSSPRSYEGVRLEPGASVPLSANRDVALDSGDGSVRMGNCLITGPGKWLRQIIGASATSSFDTGPAGDYKVTCQGGAVEVGSETVGRRMNGLKADLERRGTITVLSVAAVVGLLSLGVLIASLRANNQPDNRPDEFADDRVEVEIDGPEVR